MRCRGLLGGQVSGAERALPDVQHPRILQRRASTTLAFDAANAEATNRNDGISRVEFNDFPLTVEEFVRTVATAGDPIDLLDLGGRREIRTRTGITSGELRQLSGYTDIGLYKSEVGVSHDDGRRLSARDDDDLDDLDDDDDVDEGVED